MVVVLRPRFFTSHGRLGIQSTGGHLSPVQLKRFLYLHSSLHSLTKGTSPGTIWHRARLPNLNCGLGVVAARPLRRLTSASQVDLDKHGSSPSVTAMDEPAQGAKRRRISVASDATTVSHVSNEDVSSPSESHAAPKGRSISPPARKRQQKMITSQKTLEAAQMTSNSGPTVHASSSSAPSLPQASAISGPAVQTPRARPSPIQLTKVDGLPATDNLETVSLHDVLGDPLIKECWAFNYLFDVDWMMEHFDKDVRDMIKVHLVHGFWKKDDMHRLFIELPAQQYASVKTITAHMPEPYGTHHTKMFILFKHDDTAQVVVLTANMLERDWRMTQAVWRSPILPLNSATATAAPLGGFGSGSRFKHDLLSYLRKYSNRLRSLVDELDKYDFSAVKGALIASAPGRHNVDAADSKTTLFGWSALDKVLRSVPTSSTRPSINIQISSVGSLGVKDDWLRGILFASLARSKSSTPSTCKYNIVFPTAEEVRQAHDGYECGGSIHWKTQKPANQKQLDYMRKYLCHWAGDCASGGEGFQPDTVKDAGRKRANPHIKTYIRFSDASASQIDWVMVTSANMSKQAWGEAKKADGTVRICSYELGVIVWPKLFAEGASHLAMVPTFKRDMPDTAIYADDVIGFRMPYDLPLVRYSEDETPWCCTSPNTTPDRHGKAWPK